MKKNKDELQKALRENVKRRQGKKQQDGYKKEKSIIITKKSND